MTDDTHMITARLVDRAAIEDLLHRYFWAADDHSGAIDARSIFADDVVAHYPGSEPRHGLAAVTAFGRAFMSGFAATHHVGTNYLIDVDGERAHVRANVVAIHLRAGGDESRRLTIGGWYEFAARRTSEGWRIDGVTLYPTWTEG